MLVSSFNDFWMRESLNHFIPKYYTENRFDKIKSILFYTLIIHIVTWVSLWLFFFYWSDIIANNYFKNSWAIEVLKIFSLFFIGINIFHIISTFLIAVQSTFFNKLIDFFRMTFSLFFIVWIYIFETWSLINFSLAWIAWLYVWVIIAIIVFYFKYYIIYFKKEKVLWDMSLLKSVFTYALWILLWAQAATILGQMDMQMIILMLDTTQAWYYTNYLSIIGIPFLLIWPIFSLLFPVFSEMHSNGELEKIKRVKTLLMKNFITISIAFNILFFTFSEVIAFILFWEKFIESWVILKYSILLLVFNFMLQINFNIMAGIWRIKDRVKIISIALIFNFIMNIFLINILGVYGAALATWMGWILIWFLSEVFLGKQFMVKFEYIFVLKNITILWIFSYLLSYIFISMFEDTSRFNSLLLFVGITLIWFSLFIFINKKEFSTFIWEIKKIRWIR